MDDGTDEEAENSFGICDFETKLVAFGCAGNPG
jgi:hypothetical protein